MLLCMDVPSRHNTRSQYAFSDLMSEFWNYSLAVYRTKGVANTCLDWQRVHGADVNLLLFAGWAAVDGRELDGTVVANAVSHSTSWRAAVVQPLRNTRNWMKEANSGVDLSEGSPGRALRESIKACELTAEKMQQHRLQEQFSEQTSDSSDGDPMALTIANLGAVCRVAGYSVTADDIEAFASMLIRAAQLSGLGRFGQPKHK